MTPSTGLRSCPVSFWACGALRRTRASRSAWTVTWTWGCKTVKPLLGWLRTNRTKIWVGAVTLLLVFYLVVSFQRSVLLLTDAEPVAKAIGAAYLVLPVIGAWALIRELLFGARTEQMARVLESEGGLPEDNLPRTPAGRIIRAAADQEFEKYRAETEAAPDDWRSWFPLSCAYDASGDRKRARSSMRDAVRLFRASGDALAR